MLEYLAIIITAIFVNNIVFAQFLGICPFLGVSSRLTNATGMGIAVTVVMVISTLVTSLLQNYVLVPLQMEYMQTILFILVIAALVQMLEIIMKKVSPALYVALGVFLPLITTNCAVLGVAIMVTQKRHVADPERSLRICHGHRFPDGACDIRRHKGTARTGRRAASDARSADSPDHSRHTRNGLHGLRRNRINIPP